MLGELNSQENLMERHTYHSVSFFFFSLCENMHIHKAWRTCWSWSFSN